MRETDGPRKWGLGVERHPGVRQGKAEDWSVGSRLHWPSM